MCPAIPRWCHKPGKPRSGCPRQSVSRARRLLNHPTPLDACAGPGAGVWGDAVQGRAVRRFICAAGRPSRGSFVVVSARIQPARTASGASRGPYTTANRYTPVGTSSRRLSAWSAPDPGYRPKAARRARCAFIGQCLNGTSTNSLQFHRRRGRTGSRAARCARER